MTVRKVLIAIDESEHSLRAFNYYLNIVSRPTDEVILVHMFTPPIPPALSSKTHFKPGAHKSTERVEHPFGHDLFLKDSNSDHWQQWRAEVEATVEELKQLLAKFEGYCDEKQLARRAILHSGAPGQGLCELASDHSAHLIVIGSRGLNKIRRTFLGSVSEYVLRHSHCPVTIVPPTKKS